MIPSSSPILRNIGIAYFASVGALVAYNVRWKQLLLRLLGRSKTRELPVTRVESVAEEDASEGKKEIVVVFLHGMWHNAAWFDRLQNILSQRGFTSYAIDLLPGERILPGGTQTELVADLEVTLEEKGIISSSSSSSSSSSRKEGVILVGHSQGGLLVQSVLHTSQTIRQCVKAAVLLGTYPLGMPWPMKQLLQNPNGNMFTDIGYLYLCAFGKLMNIRYAKHIFLMPNNKRQDNGQPNQRNETYLQKLLRAPSDGFVTTTHQNFPLRKSSLPISTIPVLVLGASHDIIYPPLLLQDAFTERFPNATQLLAENQAHCFMDDGWENSMARPLLEWLEQQKQATKKE